MTSEKGYQPPTEGGGREGEREGGRVGGRVGGTPNNATSYGFSTGPASEYITHLLVLIWIKLGLASDKLASINSNAITPFHFYTMYSLKCDKFCQNALPDVVQAEVTLLYRTFQLELVLCTHAAQLPCMMHLCD